MSSGRKPSLLILQFDTQQLRRDGLCLGDRAHVVALVGELASDADVEVLETANERDLLDKLGNLAAQKRTFDVIVCIGHSNETGIRVASDRDADWAALASYLKPFKPRRLLLVACRAGRWPAANVLFQKLPTLRRIYASPVNASKDLATLMLWAVPYLLEVKAPSDKVVRCAQTVAVAFTGRQIRQWMRTRDKDNPEGVLLDFVAQIMDPYLRQIPTVMRSMLR